MAHGGLQPGALLPGPLACPTAPPPPPTRRRRSGAFAALQPGAAWWDPATRLLLRFDALGGCDGAPGLPLYNHTARGFRGYGSGQDYSHAPADFTGLAGLECARLTLTTQAPAPQGRLELDPRLQPAVEAGPTATTATQRRRLAMEPRDGRAGQIGPEAQPACGAPQALHLSLPTSQPLASLVWLDGRNRTLLTLDAASLEAERSAAAAAGAAAWAPAPLALPPGGAAAAALLAPDGRFSRVTVTPRAGQLAVEVRVQAWCLVWGVAVELALREAEGTQVVPSMR